MTEVIKTALPNSRYEFEQTHHDGLINWRIIDHHTRDTVEFRGRLLTDTIRKDREGYWREMIDLALDMARKYFPAKPDQNRDQYFRSYRR